MAGITSTTSPVAAADRLRTYFSRKLLHTAQETLRLGEFAMKADLPGKSGSKTIRFWKKRAAATTDVVALSELLSVSLSNLGGMNICGTSIRNPALIAMSATLKIPVRRPGESPRFRKSITA